MIPKTLHYCWFGKAPKSDLNKRCLESWQKVLPDYPVKEWNEINSPLDNPYCEAAYRKKSWSRLSNYVRLHALHSEGGIYLDTDVQVLRRLTPLLSDKCFLGFQQNEETIDWVNSAILGAVARHAFLKDCMELTTRVFKETGEFYRSPTVMTRALKTMGLNKYGRQVIGDVSIYPADYFYPYAWFEKFSPACITENTYCVHHWEASWRSKRFDKILSPLRQLKRKMMTLQNR